VTQEDQELLLKAISDQQPINQRVDRRLTDLETARGGLRDMGLAIAAVAVVIVSLGLLFRPGDTTVTKNYTIRQTCENRLLSFGRCEQGTPVEEVTR
jgi:hypothetical protein